LLMAVRVLFLANTLCTGGTERNIVTFCRHIDRTRFEPEVWVLHEGGELEASVRQAGVTVRSLNRGWSKSPLFALRAARRIARSEAAIVHAFLPAIGTYAVLARTIFRCRQPLVFSMGFNYMPRRHRPLFRLFSRTFDRVVCNSPSVRSVAESVGFKPEAISVIPNGHDLAWYERGVDRGAVRQKLGIAANEKMLLFVGRLTDTKRVNDGISALAIVRTTDPGTKLVIVGDGPERASLEEQARRLGIEKQVVFTGQQADVTNFLMSADVFVFPSEYEGLPNSLIEACLAGLPVVACEVPGVTDVVNDGTSAILVPTRNPERLAEGIQRLLHDPAEAERLAAVARERARDSYSVEHSVALLQCFYESLLGRTEEHPAAKARELAQPV
jgi:glycosyltransferase involved in cell wall biosynthesis